MYGYLDGGQYKVLYRQVRRRELNPTTLSTLHCSTTLVFLLMVVVFRGPAVRGGLCLGEGVAAGLCPTDAFSALSLCLCLCLCLCLSPLPNRAFPFIIITNININIIVFFDSSVW